MKYLFVSSYVQKVAYTLHDVLACLGNFYLYNIHKQFIQTLCLNTPKLKRNPTSFLELFFGL